MTLCKLRRYRRQTHGSHHIRLAARLVAAVLIGGAVSWLAPSEAADNNAVFLQWHRLAKLAAAQARQGARIEAVATWQRALETAQLLGQDSALKIATMGELVNLNFDLNRITEIEPLLDRQEALEKGLSESFPGLAQIYYQRGLVCNLKEDWFHAAQWFEQAAAISPSYTSESGVSKATLFKELAAVYCVLGRSEQCNRTIAAYQALFRRSKSAHKRAFSFHAMAVVFLDCAEHISTIGPTSKKRQRIHARLNAKAIELLTEGISLETSPSWKAEMERVLEQAQVSTRDYAILTAVVRERIAIIGKNPTIASVESCLQFCIKIAKECLINNTEVADEPTDARSRDLQQLKAALDDAENSCKRFMIGWLKSNQNYSESGWKVIWQLATCARMHKQPADAYYYYKLAEKMIGGRRIADPELELYGSFYGNAAFDAKDYVAAANLWRAVALELSHKPNSEVHCIYALCRFAAASMYCGRAKESIAALRQSLNVAEGARHNPSIPQKNGPANLNQELVLLASYCTKLLTAPADQPVLTGLLSDIRHMQATLR